MEDETTSIGLFLKWAVIDLMFLFGVPIIANTLAGMVRGDINCSIPRACHLERHVDVSNTCELLNGR